MKKQWIRFNSDIDSIRNVSRETGCHPVVATILANRRITTASDLSLFLNPSLKQIQSYTKLIDIDKAAQRIAHAIIRNEKILVFGDYDVDGVTSTVILFDFLSKASSHVYYYIPDRIKEGYGLNRNQVLNIAKPRGIDLIITVDCGSSSYDAIECAIDSNIDVIVTDHHKISSAPPKALAIINPRRSDCPSDSQYLAGAGVVFNLLICLRKYLRDVRLWCSHSQPNLKQYCDLAALGTISDIAPMIKENRIIVKTGIDVINANPRVGIRSLITSSKINKPFIDTDDIAYRIGPRINSAGRMNHANLSVKLLLASDSTEASVLSEKLNELNMLRQKEENVIVDKIKKFLKEENKLLGNSCLVLKGDALHEGVLGIVASKLAEKFYRPVLLISFKDKMGRGSGRSIPGINLYEALESCSSHLDNFGGHPMAAGLRIKTENYAAFKSEFEKKVVEMVGDLSLSPSLQIDCELNFDMISDNLVNGIETLQPFGPGNSEPVFVSKNVEIIYSKNVGQYHRRMIMKQKSPSSSSPSIPAIWFNADQSAENQRHFKEIAFKLRRNYWNGTRSLQMVIEDVS